MAEHLWPYDSARGKDPSSLHERLQADNEACSLEVEWHCGCPHARCRDPPIDLEAATEKAVAKFAKSFREWINKPSYGSICLSIKSAWYPCVSQRAKSLFLSPPMTSKPLHISSQCDDEKMQLYKWDPLPVFSIITGPSGTCWGL
jgi:hypothetical protein